MRLFVAVLLLSVATGAYAAYSNDSSSVDINYTGPALDQEPGAGGASGSGGTQGGSNGAGSGSDGAGSDGGSGGSGGSNPLEGSDEVTIPVTITVDSGNGGGGDAGGTGGAGGGGGSITAEDILNTLKGNQAVTITPGVSGGGSGWGTLTISGAKARAALRARGITKITLGLSFKNKFLSRGDLTIAAASSILDNPNLEEVVISVDVLSLSYKARGRLFAVFPLDYPVKILVNPFGGTTEDRVSVTFPWYKFFLQTLISKSALQKQIDDAVVAALSDEKSALDEKTRLYLSVTETIRLRFDTVEGSL